MSQKKQRAKKLKDAQLSKPTRTFKSIEDWAKSIAQKTEEDTKRESVFIGLKR